MKRTFLLSVTALSLCGSNLAIARPVVSGPPPAPTPSYCVSGVIGDDPTTNNSSPALSVNDMSYNSRPATDCYGPVGGNDDVNDINGLTWGINWQLAARDNIGTDPDVGNTLFGISWSLDAAPGKAGSWLLSGVDQNGTNPANLGDTFDFVGVLKGSDAWAAYFFKGVVFDGSDGGKYEIEFLNNGGKVPDLSHLTIYSRYVGEPNQVPEPTSLALAGLGLCGIALTRRRRHA